MNFGEIKYTYNTLLAESLSNNLSDGKVAFKKYIKTIKENAVLKTQFDIYYNLENKIETDGWKAFAYLNECLSLMDNFTKKEINEANKKLNENNFIKENKIKINENKVKLYSAIDTLIKSNKTSSNLDKIFEAKITVVDYILNNRKEPKVVEGYGLPNSVLSEIAVEKFNEEYGDLTESEKEAILVSIDSDDTKKEELYNKTIKECLDLVNDKLAESSGDVKEKLLATKENLLNRVYMGESFVNDISKVIELKKYLSDN
jgi:DNA-binding Lrp family transcriptional regulator